MDYEKSYKEALDRAKKLKETCDSTAVIGWCEHIFPELKGNKDRKIRNAIYDALKYLEREHSWDFLGDVDILDAYTWLEKQGEQKTSWSEEDENSFLNALWCCKKAASIAKDENEMGTVWCAEQWLKSLKERAQPKQGEQKSVDKVEPKFKVGDWVVFNGLTLYINEVVKGYYRTISKGGIPNSYDWDIDNAARLWTIEDAKDGDILSYVIDEEDVWIMIYWSLYKPYEGHVHYHALLANGDFTDKGTCCIDIDYLKPATKEQRDQLEEAMANAGYKWNK